MNLLMKEQQASPILDDFNPFEMETYLVPWWEHVSPNFDITYQQPDLLVHKKSLMKGMMHCEELRFAGWHGRFQTLTPEKISSLEEVLENRLRWDYCLMTVNLDRQDPEAFNMLKNRGFDFLSVYNQPEYTLKLDGNWDHFLKSLSKSHRTEVKRRFKKIENLSPQFETLTRPEEVDGFLESFYEHHQRYWLQKTGFSEYKNPSAQAFTKAWSKNMAQKGQLHLQMLKLAGQPTTLCFHFSSQDVLYAYRIINTGIHQEHYPGIVTMYETVKYAIENDYKYVCMGYGECNDNKRRLTNLMEKRSDIIIPNPQSIQGRIYVHWLANRLRKAHSIKY